MRKPNRKAVVVGGTVVALTAGGIAYAYWTTTGTGTGSASTRAGAPAALSVTQVSELTAMYPGDSAQGVNFTVKNEGAENYRAQAVKGYLTVAPVGDNTCDSSNYKLGGVAGTTAAEPTDLSFVAKELVPGGTQGGSTTIQFNNKDDVNQDGCKGAAVTIHYVAS